jgi:hypothetical protein
MPTIEELRKKFDARVVAEQEKKVAQEREAIEAEQRLRLLDYQASAVRPNLGSGYAYLARAVRLGMSERKICIVSHRSVDATMQTDNWSVLMKTTKDEDVKPFDTRSGTWSGLGSFATWEEAVARVESQLTSFGNANRIEVFPKCTPPFDPSKQ